MHGADDPFDPKQLRVESNTIHVKSFKAAREDRLTFSLYELPQEVLMVDRLARPSITDAISYGEY